MFKKISFIILVLLAALTVRVLAFNNPPAGGGTGSGAIATDASNNVGVGIAPVSGTKFLIKGETSDATTKGLDIKDSGGTTSVFTVTSNGVVTIASTTNVAASGIKFSDNSVLTSAPTASGATTTPAALISAVGSFGSSTGGGNYSFPATLGIGTTTPAYLLDVYVPSGGWNAARFANSSGGGLAIVPWGSGTNTNINPVTAGTNLYFGRDTSLGATIFQSGNVGIGTTTPASILDVEGASAVLNVIAPSGNPFFRLADSPSSGTRKEFTILNDTTNNRVDIQAIQQGVSTRAITINAGGGNVGVATTTPGSPLTVAGTIYSSTGGFKFPDGTTQTTAASAASTAYNSWTTSGTYVILATSTNTVGIGTTTPAAKLTVVGAAKIGTAAWTNQTGDLGVSRDAAATTGAIYFGNAAGTTYLYYDGTKFIFAGGGLTIDTGTVTATSFSGAGTGLTGTAASLTAGAISSQANSATITAATAATANTIVLRDASGYISNNYFNSSDDVNTGTITYLMGKFGDNYYRSATAAKVATFLGTAVSSKSQSQYFTVSGANSFVVPSGVTLVWVTLWGGGAGGYPSGVWYGGGGGETIYRYPLTVVAGNTLTVTIGAGGGSGANGTNSTVSGTGSLTVTAQGGQHNVGGGTGGGAAGSASAGGNGTSMASYEIGGGGGGGGSGSYAGGKSGSNAGGTGNTGGGGGASFGGTGGAGVASGTGNSAAANSGGGGGGGSTGGTGGSGGAILEWIQ